MNIPSAFDSLERSDGECVAVPNQCGRTPRLSSEDAALLASVRKALFDPWADPVFVRHIAMSRREARRIERNLSSQSRSHPTARADASPLPLGTRQPNTAPAVLQKPTLASGFEGRPPAGTSSTQRAADHRKLRMDGNGENFFHEDIND